MTVPEVISYVMQVITDLGLKPYIQAGMLITVAIGTIIGVAAWLQNR